MRQLLIFLLGALSFFNVQADYENPGGRRTPTIRCMPEAVDFKYQKVFASVNTVKHGSWDDPTVWSNNQVPGTHDIITVAHDVTRNKNIEIWNKLIMRSGSITMINIDESKFVGSGGNVLATDVGIWVMGDGQLDIQGQNKTSWTNAGTGLVKGQTTILVNKSEGWNIGDTIIITPTRKPPMEPTVGNDAFGREFEKRAILAKNGNFITVAPLTYDHLMVDGKRTPEVGNMTRNIKIKGQPGKRTHVFIRSTKPSVIRNVEMQYVGPRKGDVVNGRYGIHFHWCQDGSRGSLVEGVTIRDGGTRAFVPHVSNGITMRDNITFNHLAQAFWWDFQDETHNITWNHNLVMFQPNDGINLSSEGMVLGQGDDNRADSNVLVYAHTTKGTVLITGQGKMPIYTARGAFMWHADNEGIWEFNNNLSHSNITGLNWWQNTPHVHTVNKFESYNDWFGVFLGAYINALYFNDCDFFNSIAEIKATPGNTVGTSFFRSSFRTNNTLDYVAYAQESPIAPGLSNKFVNCTFSGYRRAAILLYSPKLDTDQFKTYKYVDVINSTFTGRQYDMINVKPATRFRVNPSDEPTLWGTGKGWKTEYYNNGNLSGEPFVTRIEPAVAFRAWDIEEKRSPVGPHHKVTGEAFSLRMTGAFEPQDNGQHVFEFEGSSGVRLWVNNNLILNSWTDPTKQDHAVFSSGINLTKGQKYEVKLEIMNQHGKRRAILYYKSPNLPRKIMPQSQMYVQDVGPGPGPGPNQRPTANAGPDIVDSAVSLVIKGSGYDPDGDELNFKWNKLSGGDIVYKQDQSQESDLSLKDFEVGDYVFELVVTDPDGLSARDTVKVTSIPYSSPEQTELSAGPDTTIVGTVIWLEATDGFPTYKWTKVVGGNANIRSSSSKRTEIISLTPGTYTFQVAAGGLFDRVNVKVLAQPEPAPLFYSDRQEGEFFRTNCPPNTTPGKITYVVLDSAFSSSVSKAQANAMALQELNSRGQQQANVSGVCQPVTIIRTITKVMIYFSDGTIQTTYPNNPVN